MIQEELFNIRDKVVLVTGASSGIGASLAALYAQAEARLALFARRKGHIDALAEDLKQKYRVQCLTVECDVKDEAMVIASVKKVIDFYGRIDVLVNNAGITEKSEDITTHTTDQWNRVLQTNLYGAYYVGREAAKAMKKAGYGKIINIASGAGLMGMANQVGYVASKSGLIGLTRAMAAELGRYNITVNAIAPGYVMTELTDEQSSGCRYFKSRTVTNSVSKPEDLFGAALLLASDASSYIHGTVIAVDGGITANI